MTRPTDDALPFRFYRVTAAEETVTFFRGSAIITYPVSPVGWREDPITCTHRHPTRAAAEKCGRHLAERTVKARNQAAVPELLATPCDIRVTDVNVTWPHDPPQWIKHCHGHQTSHTTLYPDKTVAEQAEWACPWAGMPTPVNEVTR